MGGFIKGKKYDNSAYKEQQAQLAKKEREQAAELAARRRASAGGSKSATLFSAVMDEDEVGGKKTKLGG